jgi:hypothetical protein
VSIDELVLAVSVALQSTPIQSCPSIDHNDDARVTVDELLRAVRAAFEGCPPGSSGKKGRWKLAP